MAGICAAIISALKAIWPDIVAALKMASAGLVGAKLQRGSDAEEELEKLDRAARASSRVDIMSDADVERELRKRGLYKDAPEPGGGTLN